EIVTSGLPGERSARTATWLTYAALVAGAVATVAPFLWMVSASFMRAGEANAIPPRFVPSSPTVAQYQQLFTRLRVMRYALNSAFVATVVTVLSLVVNSMAGYAF